MVSGREPVSTSIFASDQYKHLVHYEEPELTGEGPAALGSGPDRPSAPSDLEVMELDEDPVAEPDPLTDYGTPYLD